MVSALIISMIVHWSAAFVLLHTSSSETQNKSPLKVFSSGFLPVQRDDIAIILYVNMSSSSSSSVQARVEVNECCITDSFNMWICMNSIISQEYSMQFDPNGAASVEFFYPSVYPYDLKGKCTVEVFIGQKSILNHTVQFNTIQHNSKTHSHIWIMEKLERFVYGESEFPKACGSLDEDSYNDCQPVSCPLKYHGKLNYFDHLERKCFSVPTCHGDTVYDQTNNHCKNMTFKLSEEDIKVIAHTYRHEEYHPVDWKIVSNVDCNHGRKRVNSTYCICDRGWTSSPIDYRNFNPQISVYQMCDVKAEGTYWVTSIYILLVTVSLLSIILLGTMVIFFIRKRKSDRRKDKIWSLVDYFNPCWKYFGWMSPKQYRKHENCADTDNEHASLLTS